MIENLIRFVRDQYQRDDFIALHEPTFLGNERQYVTETIDEAVVSSIGAFVGRFEQDVARYTGSPRAVAAVNGTAALEVAFRLAEIGPGDLVITQPLTFVATCNAIAYRHAEPIFVDVDRHTMGLSATAMSEWLSENAFIADDGLCRTKDDRRIVRACVPMHTFGHPADLDAILAVCERWNLTLVEDAAESLGSLYKGRHTGTFGALGTISFNGNKIITTGGGGMILAGEELADRAKHLTTTAKQPHAYEYVHDTLGYNYRLPNLNAALGCAQVERLDDLVAAKRQLAALYAEHFQGSDVEFVTEPDECRSNYWLNAIICENKSQRDGLLQGTNASGVMTRPIWTLMNHLKMYAEARHGPLPNAEWLEARVVNIPSTVPPRLMP